MTTVAVNKDNSISPTNDAASMDDERVITLRDGDGSSTVSRDKLTGIEALGDTVPTALYTLSEKLERELLK